MRSSVGLVRTSRPCFTSPAGGLPVPRGRRPLDRPRSSSQRGQLGARQGPSGMEHRWQRFSFPAATIPIAPVLSEASLNRFSESALCRGAALLLCPLIAQKPLGSLIRANLIQPAGWGGASLVRSIFGNRCRTGAGAFPQAGRHRRPRPMWARTTVRPCATPFAPPARTCSSCRKSSPSSSTFRARARSTP